MRRELTSQSVGWCGIHLHTRARLGVCERRKEGWITRAQLRAGLGEYFSRHRKNQTPQFGARLYSA